MKQIDHPSAILKSIGKIFLLVSLYSWVARDVTKRVKYNTKEPFEFLS